LRILSFIDEIVQSFIDDINSTLKLVCLSYFFKNHLKDINFHLRLTLFEEIS